MSRPIQPIHMARCPCHDCSLTAPIRGSFAYSTSASESGYLTYSHQLENHRLPTHLQSYDIASPRLNGALQVPKDSLVEAIHNYVRYTAATIFFDWATYDDELANTGFGTFIGAQHHLALALVRETTTIDWEGVWKGIWKARGPSSILGGTNEAAYKGRLLAADAAIELMLRGFPRLDVCSPHRIQIFGQKKYNRQGYCLRIHHSRVPPGWRRQNRGDTNAFYDTTEISPIAVQDELIRLRLPKENVKLLGLRDEFGFLGAIRLAHELILNEWATEARSLHFSRLSYPPQEGQVVGFTRPSTFEDQPRNTQGQIEGQNLNLNIELEELAKYFKVIRAIQEVFVLNELVLQCVKPAGSSAAVAHTARINEYMESVKNDIGSASLSHTEEALQKEIGNICNKAKRRKRHDIPTKAFSIAAYSNLYQDVMKDSWKVKKGSSENRVPGKRCATTTSVNPASIKITRNDPTLCMEPWWVSGLPVSGTSDTTMMPNNATPTERSFVEQSVQQRAQKAAEMEIKNILNSKVFNDSQTQEVRSPSYPRPPEQSATDNRCSLPERLLHPSRKDQSFHHTENPVFQPQPAAQLRMPQYPQLTAVHGRLSPEAEHIGQFVDTCTDLLSLYSTPAHGHDHVIATSETQTDGSALRGPAASHTPSQQQAQWSSISNDARPSGFSSSTTTNVGYTGTITLPPPPISTWDPQQQQASPRGELNIPTGCGGQTDHTQLLWDLRPTPRGPHGYG